MVIFQINIGVELIVSYRPKLKKIKLSYVISSSKNMKINIGENSFSDSESK